MAPNSPVLVRSVKEDCPRGIRFWKYAERRTSGGFRAISVSALLDSSNSPFIELYEWPNGLNGEHYIFLQFTGLMIF